MSTISDLPEIIHPEILATSDMNDESDDVDDLESTLMSDFSKSQIGAGDCPQTFSPIGSERTSPEQGLL